MKKTFALLLVFLLCAGTALASGMPKPSKEFYYYDTANVLNEETEAVIYYNNEALYKACGAQIVVAAIPTTGRDTTENYAYKLMSSWGVGDKKKDNGFLLLLAIDDDDYYMVRGTGTNAILTPGQLGDLLYNYLEEDFAAKDYSAGVQKVFEQTFKKLVSYYNLNLAYQNPQALRRSGKIEAETVEVVKTPERQPAKSSDEGSGIMGLVVLAIIVIIIVAIVKSRRKPQRRGAVIVPPANPTPTVVVAPRVRMTGGVRPRAARPARPVQYRSPSGLGGLFGGLSGLGGSSSSRSSSPSSRSSSSSSRSSGWSSSSSSSSRSSSFRSASGGGGHTKGSGAGRRR
ncbi:MAG: TPM domain-containing protein [Clostridia bacterium]|nr:TPM domain-containing protein [Clostridia bacterium]